MRTSSFSLFTHRALLLALVLLPACNSNKPEEPDPQKMLELHREQALGYYDQKALLQAEDQIRKGLEIAPDDEQLKLMLGWTRQRRGTREDLEVAERVFRDLAPKKDFRAILGLAECLERKGVLYTESAEKIASGERETEALDPQKRAQELRLDAVKFWKEAVTHYEAVLATKPSESQAMNGLQRTYALLGREEDSLVWANKLLAQAQDETAFWEAQLKRTDLRADEETRIRERLADSRELTLGTHLAASTLLMKLGRKSEAAEHLDRVVLISPTHAGAYSRRAQILYELGRYDEARANLDDFLRLSELDFDHPDIQRAYQLRAECERRIQIQGSAAK